MQTLLSGQSERAYYLSYFIMANTGELRWLYLRRVCKLNSLRFWLRLRLLLTSMESMEGEVVNSEGYVSWSSVFLRVWELWPNFVRAKLHRKGFCAPQIIAELIAPFTSKLKNVAA